MVTLFGYTFAENYLWSVILVGLLIICCVRTEKEFFEAPSIQSIPEIASQNVSPGYRADKLYLGGSTKSFSCEKDLIRQGQPPYLGNPTKCFACGSQARNIYDPNFGQYGQSNKCFSCESNFALNPFRNEIYSERSSKCHNLNQPIQKCQKSHRRQYETIGGQSYNDNIENDNVGLFNGFGRVDGMGFNRESNQNPTGYKLKKRKN